MTIFMKYLLENEQDFNLFRGTRRCLFKRHYSTEVLVCAFLLVTLNNVELLTKEKLNKLPKEPTSLVITLWICQNTQRVCYRVLLVFLPLRLPWKVSENQFGPSCCGSHFVTVSTVVFFCSRWSLFYLLSFLWTEKF